MKGYFYTYDPAGSADGKSKADEAQAETDLGHAFTGGKYVAFYMATHYDPGVALTFSGGKRGKWFLPSMGQLVRMVKVLGKATGVPSSFSLFGSITMPGGVAHLNVNALDKPFVDAGALGGKPLNRYWYWSSSEYNNDMASGLSLDHLQTDDDYYIILDSKFTYGCSVRSFIHF